MIRPGGVVDVVPLGPRAGPDGVPEIDSGKFRIIVGCSSSSLVAAVYVEVPVALSPHDPVDVEIVGSVQIEHFRETPRHPDLGLRDIECDDTSRRFYNRTEPQPPIEGGTAQHLHPELDGVKFEIKCLGVIALPRPVGGVGVEQDGPALGQAAVRPLATPADQVAGVDPTQGYPSAM